MKRPMTMAQLSISERNDECPGRSFFLKILYFFGIVSVILPLLIHECTFAFARFCHLLYRLFIFEVRGIEPNARNSKDGMKLVGNSYMRRLCSFISRHETIVVAIDSIELSLRFISFFISLASLSRPVFIY